MQYYGDDDNGISGPSNGEIRWVEWFLSYVRGFSVIALPLEYVTVRNNNLSIFLYEFVLNF